MQKPKRFLLYACIALLFSLFLEGVVFQYRALSSRALTPYPLEVSTSPGQTEWTMDPLQLSEVQTIGVTFSGTVDVTRVELLISDDGHRHVRVNANETLLCPADPAYASRVMVCRPQGNLYGITLKWDKEGAQLTGVRINEPVPYRFRMKRFLLVLAIALFALCVRMYRLWDIVFDPGNKKHLLSYAGTALACMLFAVYLAGQLKPYDETLFPWAQQISYPFEQPAEAYEPVPHALLFDALYHGSPSIRVTPDARLQTLENVYDYSQREEAVGNYAYWWDYAYLDGKLYVYFGLAPVLLCYVPYYFLTGMLPSYVQVSLFLSLLSIAGAFLAVYALARRYVPKCPLFALCCGAAAVVCGSLVYMLQACPARYHISIASAQAGFFFTVATALFALQASGIRRRVLFFACALCTALVVLSRPSVAISASGWLLVFFLPVLFDKTRPGAERAKDAASYLVPVVLCGILVGAYNAWRFGDPLDFGMAHMLSLWDMHETKVTLSALPKAIWHYGFEPMAAGTDFPWLRLIRDNYTNHTGNYHMVNMAGNAGAFAVPLVWGNLLFVFREKQDAQERPLRPLFLASLGTVTACALVSYCLGGVSERYVCDLLPALCLTGVLCLLRVLCSVCTVWEAEDSPAREGRGVLVRRVFLFVCVLTLVTGFSRAYANEVNAVALYAPQRYLSLVDLFSIP